MKALRFLLAMLVVLLSLPVTAQADSAIELRELADGVWMHTSHYTYPSGNTFPSNGLVVRDGKDLLLVDTAWGELQTVELLRVIASQINLPVTSAIVTHSHGDRAAGIDVLRAEGIKVFAHPLTRKFTIEHGLPVPDQSFEALEIQGAKVEFENTHVLFPGAAHTEDNLMVWLPEQNILYGGCAVRALASGSAGNTAHADLESWERAMEEVGREFKSARIVVPGHGKPGGLELLVHTKKLVVEASQ